MILADPAQAQNGWLSSITPFVGGVITLIGTLLTVLVTWIKDRDTDARRSKRMEDAAKRLVFWKSVLELNEDDGSVVKAKQQIQQVSDEVADLFPPIAKEASDAYRLYLHKYSLLRRWLLLYPRPITAVRLGWRVRAARYPFYAFVVGAAMLIPVQLDTYHRVLGRYDKEIRENISRPDMADLTTKWRDNFQSGFWPSFWIECAFIVVITSLSRRHAVNLERQLIQEKK